MGLEYNSTMTKHVTRRELGIAAIGAAAAMGSSQAALLSGGGALDSTDEPNGKEFDPVAWTMDQYANAPLRLTFRAGSAGEAKIWQSELRSKLVELLGGFPPRLPLRPRIVDVREFPRYKREKFVFESRPGVAVMGYLLTPVNAAPRTPVAVCIPGHGRGVDDIVGIDANGKDRSNKPGYQHDFAVQVVEHGLAAVAIEPAAFGHRRDVITRKKGRTATACQPAAGSALLLGQTMLGWRVWDTMRVVDWIETRPELDAGRIGCVGISGGGTCTQFTAALDERIKVAFVSGYLNTFRDSIMSLSHCIDNYVPGILNWAENYDVAGLIAPRFLFSEGGNRDPIFPVNATIASFGRVKKVYEVFGAPDHTQQEIFDGVHEFHGARGLPFLKESLLSA